MSINKFIIIMIILCFSTTFCFAQTVSGRVVDSDSVGIPGATVIKKGGSGGTVTDSNGNFTIQASVGDKLVVSFIGYTTIEFQARAGTNLLVLGTNSSLSEVVIAASRDRLFNNALSDAIDFNSSISASADSVLAVVNDRSFVADSESETNAGVRKRIREVRATYEKTTKSLKGRRRSSNLALQKIIQSSNPPLSTSEIRRRQNIIDSTYAAGKKSTDEIFYASIDVLINALDNVVLPARNSFAAAKFYNSSLIKPFDLINSTGISANFKNGAFTNELVSSFLGPFRVSLNTILSRQKVTQIDNSKIGNLDQKGLQALIASTDSINIANSTLMKVASGGGELGLNFKIPILNFGSKNPSSTFSALLEVGVNATTDLPVAGSYIGKDSLSFFYMLQGQLKIILRPTNFIDFAKTPSEFYFYAIDNYNYVGGTKSFYQNLTIPDGKRFQMHSVTGGIHINNQFSVFYTHQYFDISELQSKISSRLGLVIGIK